jgi:DNA-binding transcriptional regulator YiaG
VTRAAVTRPAYWRTASLVQRARKACGETQATFAARLGIHPMTVSKWERGAIAPGRNVQSDLRDLIDAAKISRANKRGDGK